MKQKTSLISLALLCSSVSIAVLAPLAGQPTLDPETGYIPRPSSRPILQVAGNIAVSSNGETAYFSYSDLKSFKQHKISIKRPWFDQEREQAGPLLRDVLKFLGAKGTHLKVAALNDYATTIPIEDAYAYPVVLAIELDGKPMPVREMGPVFITYPMATNPELRKETFFARSVWQVKSITIE